jgi:hypothetical protein
MRIVLVAIEQELAVQKIHRLLKPSSSTIENNELVEVCTAREWRVRNWHYFAYKKAKRHEYINYLNKVTEANG